MSLILRSRSGVLLALAMVLGSLLMVRLLNSPPERAGEIARNREVPRLVAPSVEPGRLAPASLESVRTLLAGDPVGAAVLAERLPAGLERVEACELVARAWTRSDPAAARLWIMDQDDAALRDRLIDASVRAGVDPYAALEWAVGSIQSEDQMENTVLSVVDRWAESRPAEAAALVDELPEDDLRARTADVVAQHWNQINPTVAYIWMKSSPEGDRLIAGLTAENR